MLSIVRDRLAAVPHLGTSNVSAHPSQSDDACLHCASLSLLIVAGIAGARQHSCRTPEQAGCARSQEGSNGAPIAAARVLNCASPICHEAPPRVWRGNGTYMLPKNHGSCLASPPLSL